MAKLLPLASLATLLSCGTALAAPNIVASTKPIHSLVAAVMGDVGTPTLLVRGAASPHTYSLRPSDAAALEAADIVFWTGPGFEMFLGDALGTLSTKAELISFADMEGLNLLSLREGGAFEAHDHDHGDHDHGEEHDHDHTDHDHEGHDHTDHEGHDHDHAHDDEAHAHGDHEGHDHSDHGREEGHDHAHGENGDLHFWLDPVNASLMVDTIEAALAKADPENAQAYAANADATRENLAALTEELTAQLAPIADKPFIVFHDAYQYFETRFGLTLAGTVTVSPDVAPGASRIDELRAKVAELDATCVFAEPNFEPAVVRVITESTDARAGMLDPEGSALTEGPNLYPELLRSLATGLVDCLGAN